MPITHDARFASACLLAVLAHLEEASDARGPQEPLELVLEQDGPGARHEGYRAVALPHGAVPAGTQPTFVYKRTEARLVKAHTPEARIIDPKDWRPGLVKEPRLLFVDPVFARAAGAERHTVKLGGQELAALVHRGKNVDFSRLFGVHSKGRMVRVLFGYADMAPDCLRRNMLAVLERSRAILGAHDRDVRRVCIGAPHSVPIEIVGPLAQKLAEDSPTRPSKIRGGGADLAQTWGATRIAIRKH